MGSRTEGTQLGAGSDLIRRPFEQVGDAPFWRVDLPTKTTEGVAGAIPWGRSSGPSLSWIGAWYSLGVHRPFVG